MKRSLLFVVLTLAAISASANSNQQNDLPAKPRSALTDVGPDSTVSDIPRQHSDDSHIQSTSSEEVCAAFLGGDDSDEASGFDVEY